MTDQPRQIGGGRRTIGDVAPKLAELTDDVLFEDVWNRTELAARDRSLITVAVLIGGDTSLAAPPSVAPTRPPPVRPAARRLAAQRCGRGREGG
ncbi:hypothetical protein SVIOM74S_08606 [Streptomyces violarus]